MREADGMGEEFQRSRLTTFICGLGVWTIFVLVEKTWMLQQLDTTQNSLPLLWPIDFLKYCSQSHSRAQCLVPRDGLRLKTAQNVHQSQ